jgi:hypothetical protein
LKVLITGDSHVISLVRANAEIIERQGNRDPTIDVYQLGTGLSLSRPFLADRGSFAEITNPECSKNFKRLPPSDPQYDVIGISAPLHSTRVWRQTEWKDFTLSDTDSLDGASVISQGALRKIIDDEIGPSLDLIDIVRRTTPVFVIEGPWPFRRHPAVAANGDRKVQYLHKAFHNRARAALKERNVPIVDFDPLWADEEGFTLVKFRNSRNRDYHHCNTEFGHLVMAKIRSFLLGSPFSQDCA